MQLLQLVHQVWRPKVSNTNTSAPSLTKWTLVVAVIKSKLATTWIQIIWTRCVSKNKAAPISSRKAWLTCKAIEMGLYCNTWTLRKSWKHWKTNKNRRILVWSRGRRIFSWWSDSFWKHKRRRILKRILASTRQIGPMIAQVLATQAL